ncbi:MAG TPA: ferritin-like domain-containing protein [Polyangium sp.]|nr:ferritin-like domain-containing protein [Polyangium sp.]
MNRSLVNPRLSALDVFASILLATLGLEMQTGCGSHVEVDNPSSGGAGGMGASTSNGSSSSSGDTTTSSSSSSSSSGFIPGTGDCVDPQPVIVDGIDVGVDICAGGQYLRREAIDCPAGTPGPNTCCGTCPDGQVCDTSGEVACLCVPTCVKDADCMAGQLCLCGQQGGRCITSTCHTAADCPPEQQCTSWDPTQGCLYLQFACTTPQDTCSGDKDCSEQVPFSFCTVQADGHRECQVGGCAIGRPFLVDGEARTADIVRRADWTDEHAPNTAGLDERIRAELAAAWEHTARMEHASIAAFARFSLELLALGAPSDLIMRTNAAMVDETNHSRMAFAMASAYRGEPVGPGRLALEGALGEADVASFVQRLIREGCVGETVAAVEAGEAADRAMDPVVGKALDTISTDESMHSNLAWRTLLWALKTFGTDVREVIRCELGRLRDELETVHEARRTAEDEALLDHGVVTTNVRGSIRRAVLRQVVVPCLEAVEDNVMQEEQRMATAL